MIPARGLETLLKEAKSALTFKGKTRQFPSLSAISVVKHFIRPVA
jgi:hypothetical protein